MSRAERSLPPARVYRIIPDERFQRLTVRAGPDAGEQTLFTADRIDTANPRFSARVVNPGARAGRLWYVEGGAIAVRPDREKPPLTVDVPVLGLSVSQPHQSTRHPGCDAIQGPLEMAGQLLPLTLDGGELILLNVLECINCLDRANTLWLDGPSSGPDARIARYVFHSNRFIVSSIFKIPETCASEVLVVERFGDPEEEFKAGVERAGIGGIAFELLWQQDGGD